MEALIFFHGESTLLPQFSEIKLTNCKIISTAVKMKANHSPLSFISLDRKLHQHIYISKNWSKLLYGVVMLVPTKLSLIMVNILL